jgi:hypothetical protein
MKCWVSGKVLSIAGMVNREEFEKGTSGEGILLWDGNDGRLDGGEDFGEGFRIELMSVEAQKEPFPNGLDRGLRVAFSEGRLDEGAGGIPHGTPHDQSFFAGTC